MAARTTRSTIVKKSSTSRMKKEDESQPSIAKAGNSKATEIIQKEKQRGKRTPASNTGKRKRSAIKDEDKSMHKPTFEDIKEEGAAMAAKFVEARDLQREESPLKKAKRTKANPYGLSPGESPFPDYPHPTPDECAKVVKILEKEHGKVSAPKTIPTPSLNSSGCGEVPSVLDALIRTRLSAATNNANSNRAFRGLVERFGILKEGIGKGSVDWNAVRIAPVKDVFEAIQSGGLADVKSKDIKKILQMVYEENQERGDALVAAELDKTKANGVLGIKNEPEDEREGEIKKAKSNVLSLDHLHLMSNEDAFEKLIGYPGIGPKTASCVLLFCLQRPSFAVDTHVFRLCKLLKWVPLKQNPTRNSTYAHCDVRVPGKQSNLVIDMPKMLTIGC